MDYFTFAHRQEGFDEHIDWSIRGYRNLLDDVINLSRYFVNYSFWVILVSFLCAFISITFWTFVGKFFRRFATNEKFIKVFNYVMSCLLLSCIATFYL